MPIKSTSFKFPPITLYQLSELSKLRGQNKTEVLIAYIEAAYQREIEQPKSKAKTRKIASE